MATSTKSNKEIEHKWVCTQVRGSQIKYDWIIKNFELFSDKKGEFIQSSVFPANNIIEQWQLTLYPQGPATKKTRKISLYLQPALNEMCGIKVKCEFIILRSKQILDKQSFIHQYNDPIFHGLHRFTEKSKILTVNSSNSDDTITIRCKIDVLGTTITSSDMSSQTVSFESDVDVMQKELRLSFTNPEYSDFTVIAGGKKFPVHKSILASRSHVFATMFEHKNFDENVKNEVKIDNMTPDVVKGMLEFMYTDDVLKIDKLAHGLLSAAEQYGLKGLKTLCQETLYKTLDVDNAAEILVLADLYGAAELKHYVIQFIADHHSLVIASKHFESTEIPQSLMRELFCALSISTDNAKLRASLKEKNDEERREPIHLQYDYPDEDW